jgi:hypothetical protein
LLAGSNADACRFAMFGFKILVECSAERLMPAIHQQQAISACIYLVECLTKLENTSEAYHGQVPYSPSRRALEKNV